MAEQRPLPRFQARRQLGRTGFRATAVGLGDLADRSVPVAQCVATLHRAMDAGLNRPLTAEQMTDVRQRAARAIEGKGAVWWNPAA